ncbi:MAG: cell division protein FtsZ [Inquilinaceae bacterium]
MINLQKPDDYTKMQPRITVVGVGGAGGNAVNNMINSNLEGAEFLVCNTDAQALNNSIASKKLQIGIGITQGLGAGARPDVGQAAAEEALEDIMSYLEGSHMAFITAGMGGGTGTGAAPVIARAAREQGILTVGVVTKPFHFEGMNRMRLAEAGIQELQQYVDTLIVIPNQNLFRVANEKTSFADAFAMADEVLNRGVRGVTDLMIMPGLINLDFNDIRTVMSEMGKAMMGTGEAAGERRAVDAAEAAIANPLLDDVSMKGARAVLINVASSRDVGLYEIDEACNRIREEVDEQANIIFGAIFDDSLEDKIRVSVVATGIDAAASEAKRPTQVPAGLHGSRPTPVAVPAPEPVAAAQPPAEVPEPRVAEQVTREPIQERPRPAAAEREVAASAVARGDRQGGAFIAPRPVAVPSRAAPAAPYQPAAGRGEEEPGQAGPDARRRGGNLFRRVTGLLREDEEYGQMEPAPQPAASYAPPRPQPQRIDPRMNRPEPVRPAMEARPDSRPAPVQPAPAAQPRLSGFEMPARETRPSSDDDLLEIPAFLRRQAN